MDWIICFHRFTEVICLRSLCRAAMAYCPTLDVRRLGAVITPPTGFGDTNVLDFSSTLWTAAILETRAHPEPFMPPRNNVLAVEFMYHYVSGWDFFES